MYNRSSSGLLIMMGLAWPPDPVQAALCCPYILPIAYTTLSLISNRSISYFAVKPVNVVKHCFACDFKPQFSVFKY